jgi:protein SCO1/2
VRRRAATPPCGRATAVIVLCAAIALDLPQGGRTRAHAEAVALAAFEAIDHNGKAFSSASLSGQPYAIFFGFTRCPDVCPTTLLEVSQRLQDLATDGNGLKVLFVTVDSEHDTPDRLRAYLSSFDSRIIGLTGSEQQIAAIAKVYGASYYKLREADGSYSMTHSAYVYLVDRNNCSAGTLTFQDTEAEQLAKLRKLLAGN